MNPRFTRISFRWSARYRGLKEGETLPLVMHDGSRIVLAQARHRYDPTTAACCRQTTSA